MGFVLGTTFPVFFSTEVEMLEDMQDKANAELNELRSKEVGELNNDKARMMG